MKPGPFSLTLLASGKEGRFFAIHFDGEPKNEFDALLDRFSYDDAPDLFAIDEQINEMCERLGFRDVFFTSEDKYPTPLAALRYNKGPHRVYCCRYGRDVLVVGGGGFKPDDADGLQDVPELKKAYDLVRYVSDEIDRQRESGALPNVYHLTDGQRFDPDAL